MADVVLYSPTQAAKAAHISIQSLRNYAKRYRTYLSPHATPQAGETRWFTIQDIRLLAYIAHKTIKQNVTHEQLVTLLDKATGELEQFTDYDSPDVEQPSESTELMAPGLLRAYEVLVNDAKQREQAALDREQKLQQRVEQLEHELGKAQGALDSYRVTRRRPRWWTVLFGGE
jgi:DNA-binding transcriptional MerR regulator